MKKYLSLLLLVLIFFAKNLHADSCTVRIVANVKNINSSMAMIDSIKKQLDSIGIVLIKKKVYPKDIFVEKYGLLLNKEITATKIKYCYTLHYHNCLAPYDLPKVKEKIDTITKGTEGEINVIIDLKNHTNYKINFADIYVELQSTNETSKYDWVFWKEFWNRCLKFLGSLSSVLLFVIENLFIIIALIITGFLLFKHRKNYYR